MNKYESIIIINSLIAEEARVELIKKINELISNVGKLENVEEWGLKKLAYPIEKQQEGYYVLYTFESKPDFITELERVYGITDGIVKHIVIRK